MFNDRLKQEIEKIAPSEQIKTKIIEKIQSRQNKKININPIFFRVTAFCLTLVIVIAGSLVVNNYYNNRKIEQSVSKDVGFKNDTKYINIFNAIRKNRILMDEDSYSFNSSTVKAGNEKSSKFESQDFSKTNIQVENVDEEDIVKTDGKYIYSLDTDNEKVRIYSAAGEKSKKLSSFFIVSDINLKKYDYSPEGMFLYNNKLVIIGSLREIENQYDKKFKYYSDCYYMNYYNENVRTQVLCYDISNRSQPKYLSSYMQSGSYNTSRMVGAKLVLSSNYNIYYSDKELKSNNIEKYIPIFTQNNKEILQDAKNIYMMKNSDQSSYVVLSIFDVETDKRISDKSIFGGGELSYSTQNDLFVTKLNYNDNISTTIYKININDGELKISAKGSVNGEILNQFSLDEYNGYLRLVTTEYSYGETNDYEEHSSNSLYILDDNLNVYSSIKNLAKGEEVYSVRFLGNLGYFVTFEQTDPLFCVDLKDPKNPVIKDKLKIPGFSDYLHPFADGLLLGFGVDGDEEGNIEDLKLSMFDVSNPIKISEKFKLKIKGEYAEANSNHKAILVYQKRNIIAFQCDNYYCIFNYSDKEGFTLVKKYKLSNEQCYLQARGSIINNNLYINYNNKMIVVNIDNYQRVLEFN